MRTLIILLLWASLAHGAQVIIIPEGTTTYGPIAMNQLHRVSQVSFTRTSNTFTSLTVAFYYCPGPDVKTCDSAKTWTWYGESFFPGGGATTASLGSLKVLAAGVTATHIKVIAVAVGGNITLQKDPTVVTK
jgi:hypothetical protein